MSEAAADANRALALLEKLQKRPDETDEQFQARKGALAADAHFALGMEEMQQDQFDKAVADYQAAISSTSKPTFQYYYRLAEAYASEGQVSRGYRISSESVGSGPWNTDAEIRRRLYRGTTAKISLTRSRPSPKH